MTTLRPDQVPVFDFCKDKPASMLSVAMGGGKSALCIKLADHWNAQRILILCPTSVRAVWRREIPRHADRKIRACILDTGSVRKRTAKADAAYKSKGAVAIVVNYEAAWREPMKGWILAHKWDVIACDESQKIQRTSRTSEFVYKLHDIAEHRLCLSGSPLTQDCTSAWAQCRFLDPTIFGLDLREFVARYHNKKAVGIRKAIIKTNEHWLAFCPDGTPFKMPAWATCGTINTREYLGKLGKVAIRVENTALNLPPITIERRVFRLGFGARHLHDFIEGRNRKEIETGLWRSLRRSFSVVMRLQQITSGWLKMPSGEPGRVDHGKGDCLSDIMVEAGGEPMVVFARFVYDLDITRELAEKHGLVYAEISQRRKDGLTNKGTMPPGVQVCGVQEQAGGVGIDLTLARLVVRYSPSWVVPNFDQTAARVYRPPQDRSVIVYELCAEDSIDEELYRAITARKEMIADLWKHCPQQPVAAP